MIRKTLRRRDDNKSVVYQCPECGKENKVKGKNIIWVNMFEWYQCKYCSIEFLISAQDFFIPSRPWDKRDDRLAVIIK